MFQFFVTFAQCFLFKRRKTVPKPKLHLHRSRRRFRVRSSDWYHTKALCLNFQENKPISLCRKYPARYFRKSVKTCYLKKVDHCYPESPRVRYANYRFGTGSELDSCDRSLLGTANGVVTTNHILSRSSNYRDFSNDPLFFQLLKPDWSYEKTRQGSFIGSKRYLVRMRCPIFSSIGPVDHSPAIAGSPSSVPNQVLKQPPQTRIRW